LPLENLTSLIRQSLSEGLASPDYVNKLGYVPLSGPPVTFRFHFSSELVRTFEWQLLGLRTRTNGNGSHSVIGCGIVEGENLRRAFADAGFAPSFVFLADEELRVDKGKTIPVFDPRTAQIDLLLTITPFDLSPRFQDLDDDIGQFLSLAGLKFNDNRTAP
jgi:hypothetical protein